MKGVLPWQGLQGRTKDEKYERIKDKKVQTTIEELVSGMLESQVFLEYLYYCRNLRFDEKPDYQFLRRLFKDAMYRNGFEYDYLYDWMPQEKTSQKKAVVREEKKEPAGKVGRQKSPSIEKPSAVSKQNGLSVKPGAGGFAN